MWGKVPRDLILRSFQIIILMNLMDINICEVHFSVVIYDTGYFN